MKTEERYALLLSLIDNLYTSGSWCGETHIQKSTFFLEELKEVSTDLGFVLYKHGPYSFDLHDILGDMLSLGFIEQEQRPPYGPRLRLKQVGKDFLKRNKSVSKYYDAIMSIVGKFSHSSVQSLEKIATALLIHKQDPGQDTEKVAQELNKLKPHISLPEAREAAQEMRALLDL